MRRAEMSTTIRVSTRLRVTSSARTNPVMPFGRSGSWTRYHMGVQSGARTTARTLKIVFTPLTFRRAKRSSTEPPGFRYAVARSRTDAT
jgi:hypothetical protein